MKLASIAAIKTKARQPGHSNSDTMLLLIVSFLMLLPNSALAEGSTIPLVRNDSSPLVKEFSKIVCRARIKVLFVYFENETSLAATSQILPELMKCNICYITLRNKFRTRALDAIKDDGILMYLVMLLNDVTQPLALSLIRKKSAAKHLSHVFLLVRNSRTISEAWLRASFRQFWQIWLLNVVIIYWQNERLHIYRYNPFANDYLIAVKYDTELPTLAELFPKVIPNMQRKPLRMCIFPDDERAIFQQNEILGTDGILSEYIAERLNATRQVQRVHSSNRLHGLSSDICFNEIAKEYDDVALNIRFLSPEILGKAVEPTIAHNRDDLCVIVPKAPPAPIFWNIFRSFDGLIWLSLLLSVLLANGFCQLLSCRRHNALFALQLFAYTLSLPVARFPSRHALRVFLICWLYFGMLICTAFRGNLTGMLVFQKSLPDINDIAALAASDYKIFLRTRHLKFIDRFFAETNENEAKVRQQMVPLAEKQLIQLFNSNNHSFAYVEKHHVASFQVNSRNHMVYGHPVFHLMSTCLVPFHAVYIVPYGSPYLGYLNFLIRGALEFGFERYWDRIMNVAFINTGAKILPRQQKNHNDNPVVLRIEHLYAVFCMWTCGLVLALLVFLWELLTAKRTTRKRKH